MKAYNDDADLKRTTLERVNAHIAARQIVPLVSFWDGTQGSVAACAVHDPDPRAFEAALDIPRGLVPIVDAIYRKTYSWAPPDHPIPVGGLDPGEVALARRFPAEWLEAIEPGTDLSNAASQMILWVLSETRRANLALSSDSRVSDLLEQVASFHREDLSGREVRSQDWASVRNQAVALADASPRGSIEAAAAVVAESAAWPKAPSGSVVLDVFESYVRIADAEAASCVGWTPAEHDIAEEVQAETNRVMEEETRGLEGKAWELQAEQIMTRRRRQTEQKYPGLEAKQHELRSNLGKYTWARLLSCQQGLLNILRT
jgi:hypothetical protein